jgi:hypothetical protein
MMLILKRFLIFTAVLAFLPVMVAAQTQTGFASDNREMSVEQSYLQESVELMIIREQSRTDSRDMKMVALEYIGEAIDRGNRGEEIRNALEFLSLEGVVNVARENGRVVNNFPDVRKEAATYLGKLGTPEAKDTLLKMVNGDNEPMVITEAIRSLGIIGTNNADEVTKTISWTVNRFHGLNPDNFMALSALDAFSKIAAANKGIKDLAALEIIIKIAEGPYITPVKNRARELLAELRQYGLAN